ncbi:MAG: hypothetical protein LUD14_08430 [Clostridiales bacterium]|nr:hypothetical protein [Clostridiales bacterium]
MGACGRAGERTSRPELTREEYLRLLSTTKSLGRERLYFIIKLFACTGFKLSQIQRLTLEEVRAGKVTGPKAINEIPNVLRMELLDYAERKDITGGMLFCTRSGAVMDRSNLSYEIQELAKPANVDPEKCNPRCLIYLYRNTQKGILESMRDQVRKANEKILEQEQEVIGWGQ